MSKEGPRLEQKNDSSIIVFRKKYLMITAKRAKEGKGG
jgi:hypothetical protein